MRLTNKQKHIVSCVNPYYNGFASKIEIRAARRLARGHFWIDKEWEEYVAISPSGRRMMFGYLPYSPSPWELRLKWLSAAREAARLWAHGKYKEAKIHCDLFYNIESYYR